MSGICKDCNGTGQRQIHGGLHEWVAYDAPCECTWIGVKLQGPTNTWNVMNLKGPAKVLPLRCLVTGNLCGTDTELRHRPCTCVNCGLRTSTG